MKIKILIISLLIISSSPLKSQKDSIDFHSKISLNAPALLTTRMLFTYTSQLNDRIYYDITLGYKYFFRDEIEQLEFMPFTDYPWLYNIVSIRFGLRKYLIGDGDPFFLGVSTNYHYRFNNNVKIIRYVNEGGDAYDQDWVFDKRQQHVIGLLFKSGMQIFENEQWKTDFFVGIGMAWRAEKYIVAEKYETYYGNKVWDDRSILEKNNRLIPTIHLGLDIGRNSNKKIILRTPRPPPPA